MGSKGLWRHVEGTVIAPKLYALDHGILVLSDGQTPATEEQIEARESKIVDYDKWEYLAQHVILSMTSTHLSSKIKNLKMVKEMWDMVKADATTKSTLFLLDAKDQLTSMKLADNTDPKTHLFELKEHFQLMMHQHDNLLKIGPTLSNLYFNTIIMSSLPESYHLSLQTIMAAKHTSAVLGMTSSKWMKADDLISFFIEGAQHWVINDEHTRNAESALAAHGKNPKKVKSHQKKNSENLRSSVTCKNCNHKGHLKEDCWSKGGEKEGQGPRNQKPKKEEKTESVVVAELLDDELFVFMCTLDFADIPKALQIPKSWLRACMDSGASHHYCLDHDKFENYQPISGWNITTADGCTLRVVGVGDVHIELPNGLKQTKAILKEAIYAPDMAFTLISISQLDNTGSSIIFHKGMCIIKNPQGWIIATIPWADGLYCLIDPYKVNQMAHVNVATGKMSISEAYCKLGHISHTTIKHAVTSWWIAGIDLDIDSKPEFCEPCAKAKSASQPLPKKSDTWATQYGKHIHWDL